MNQDYVSLPLLYTTLKELGVSNRELVAAFLLAILVPETMANYIQYCSGFGLPSTAWEFTHMLPSQLSKLIIHVYNLTHIKCECLREPTWRDGWLEHRFPIIYCMAPLHHGGTGLAGSTTQLWNGVKTRNLICNQSVKVQSLCSYQFSSSQSRQQQSSYKLQQTLNSSVVAQSELRKSHGPCATLRIGYCLLVFGIQRT